MDAAHGPVTVKATTSASLAVVADEPAIGDEGYCIQINYL